MKKRKGSLVLNDITSPHCYSFKKPPRPSDRSAASATSGKTCTNLLDSSVNFCWTQQGRSWNTVLVQSIEEINNKQRLLFYLNHSWRDLGAAMRYHRDKQQDGTLWELWHLKETESGMKCVAVGELKTLHSGKPCLFLKKQRFIWKSRVSNLEFKT